MRGFSSADHKLTGEQKGLPLFVLIAMFMWDVFVGELGVVFLEASCHREAK